MSCLPKPVLRRHAARAGLKMIIGSILFGSLNGSLYYFLVKIPRAEKYENFLKTYDAEAHFNDLVKWGYIQNKKNEE